VYCIFRPASTRAAGSRPARPSARSCDIFPACRAVVPDCRRTDCRCALVGFKFLQIPKRRVFAARVFRRRDAPVLHSALDGSQSYIAVALRHLALPEISFRHSVTPPVADDPRRNHLLKILRGKKLAHGIQKCWRQPTIRRRNKSCFGMLTAVLVNRRGRLAPFRGALWQVCARAHRESVSVFYRTS